MIVLWLECRACERLLEVCTQHTGEGFCRLGSLTVGGAHSGESGLLPKQGQVCLIWVWGSLAHSCLDSAGQQTFLDSPLCASSGPGPPPVWRWTRGRRSHIEIQVGVTGAQQSRVPLAGVWVCAEAGAWLMTFSDSPSPISPSLRVSVAEVLR